MGKRHRKVVATRGVGKASIKRLARRGGVKRISSLVIEEAPKVIEAFLTNVIRDGLVMTEYSRRKTLTSRDVLNALNRHKRTLYGIK